MVIYKLITQHMKHKQENKEQNYKINKQIHKKKNI